MNPTLSVVVCTCNHADSLAQTLRRLAGQTADPARFETVAVDNCSTDETPAALAAAAAAMPNLRAVGEPNPGQAYARVRGVREARGEWIAFVDDDNFLPPEWIETALRFIDTHPHMGAFGGRILIDWETAPPPAVAYRAWAYAASDFEDDGPRRMEGEARWKLRGAGLVCRKAALVATGWLDWQVCVGRVGHGTMSGDDTEIVMRIARAGGEIWYEPALALQHRIAAGRIGVAQLRALCRGFGRVDPLLTGLETSSGVLAWANRMARLFLRRVFALARHGMRAPFSAESRFTARLTLLAVRGALEGLPAVARMTGPERARWLNTAGASAIPLAAGTARVLHLHKGELYGGIERMLACLGQQRAQSPETEPTFGLCYDARLARELRAAGARVEILGAARTGRPWELLRVAWRVRRLLRQGRGDAAVVGHGSWALVTLGWVAPRRRRVLWMHNDTKIPNKNLVERLVARVRPSRVICNSRFTAASLPLLFPNGAPPPPHTVIACPVNLPEPLPAGLREKVRTALGAAPETVVIALAGRPEAWKGHALLLETLGRLRAAPGWALWFIGGPADDDQAAFLETLRAAAEHGGIAERVQFLGQRDNVPELLAAADLFCHPNRTPEPFGIVFVEALYAGLPVVTADCGGPAEMVDASCGLLVPPGDADALLAALRRLLDDPDLRRALGTAAPARGLAVSDPAGILPAVHAFLAHG